MNDEYLTPNDRLLFLQSKHDRTDKAFLAVIFCLAVIEGIAQLVKLVN